MGIAVLPPDINESDFDFKVSETAVRFGLSAVKNVGETAARSLIEVREARGKFASPFDVCRDVDSRVVNRKVLESLVKAGAFDSLGWPRSRCFHLIDKLIEISHEAQKARIGRQNLLFGGGEAEVPEIPAEIQDMREWDESLKLSYEKDALGFYITGHPLTQFGKNLQRLISHSVSDLNDERDFNTEVRLAGIITAFRPLRTKKDERMASFFLEDLSGRVEVVAFPDAFRKNNEFLHEDRLVWIKGRFLGEGESRKVQLSQVMPLAEAFQKQAKRMVVRIFVPGIEETLLDELKEILEKSPGECPVYFELETPHAFRLVTQSAEVSGVQLSEDLTRAVLALLGEDSVHIEY